MSLIAKVDQLSNDSITCPKQSREIKGRLRTAFFTLFHILTVKSKRTVVMFLYPSHYKFFLVEYGQI